MPVQISHHLAKEATGVIVKNHSLPNSLWLGPVPHPSLSTLWDREISRVSDGFRRQHFYCDPVSGESNLKLRLPMGRTIVAEGAVPQLNTRPYPRNMESFFSPGKYSHTRILVCTLKTNGSFSPQLSSDLRAKGEQKVTMTLRSKGWCLPENWEKSSCHEVKGIWSNSLRNSHYRCVYVPHNFLVRKALPHPHQRNL